MTCTTEGITFSTTDAISGNWIEGMEGSSSTTFMELFAGVGVGIGAGVDTPSHAHKRSMDNKKQKTYLGNETTLHK